VHLENNLVIAVGEDAALVWARPADGAVELEHVLTGGWPWGIRVNDPLRTAGGQNVARHGRRCVQVVVNVEAIALLTQLG
jgi:hypothetical protein